MKRVTTIIEIKSALFGVAVGDAVGVPYEFSSRQEMIENPATDMKGYGTYHLPPGTWSDDSSLTFCLAESIASGFNLVTTAENFIKWRDEAYWTADNCVFDIGNTTNNAISQLKSILSKENAEIELEQLKINAEEYDNGNGSLMRIIPLLFYIYGKNIHEQFDLIWKVSALTHKHIRAAMSCLIYLKCAEYILNGIEKETAYLKTKEDILNFWNEINFPNSERKHFEKIIQNDIRDTSKEDLKSGGYVIEVLESSFWFFLEEDSYENTILSIINLGHDTDTSAAIVGGLAGLYYGIDKIPINWIKQITRKNDIENLAERLTDKLTCH
ncbi:MAG: ADP-ribosylglycohydrolase family protein [Chitinophagales bacterium]|nr:ADP-ribosylglycohydrolase family protein [Chitinophagales bacterium]